MERLTEDSITGGAYLKKCAYECPYDGEYCGTDECPILDAVANKLGEYERAEEDGTLIKLPCKPGDSVFIIVGRDISRQTIRKITMENGSIRFTARRRTFSAGAFGDTVFTDYDPAEKRLKEIWQK